MTNKELSEVIFPDLNNNWEYYENLYKERNLPADAIVSRFAPSPTGSMHIGNISGAYTGYCYAKQSKGIFYLRVEDTDQKREVENGTDAIINGLKELNITFDEGHTLGGEYGPYLQSERKDIYCAYAKKLIEEGKAYPCFSTADELAQIREHQEKNKMRLGCYGKFAKYRDLPASEASEKIKNKESFIIRLKSPGSFYNKVILNDLIRGKIEMPENDIDEVIIKGDGLPTYHFAHAIDDHLMRTTHIIRGDEWVSSYPKHEQLFSVLGFKLPNYAHISPINIKDNDTIRKLSKRKDPWAAVSFYNEKGIPHEVIKLYLATIMNSNFEEWYNQNSDKSIKDFTFSFDKMSITGPIFDYEKLINISKTYFSNLKATDIYDNLVEFTNKYDVDFNKLILENPEYVINMLNIEREIPKPRKDISSYEDIKSIYWFMFDELFAANTDDYEEMPNTSKEEVINYLENVYDPEKDQNDWFNELSTYANSIGFTSDRKAYKANTEQFKGMVADFCKVLRIIITKKNLSPNLYDIIKLLGSSKLIERTNKYFN